MRFPQSHRLPDSVTGKLPTLFTPAGGSEIHPEGQPGRFPRRGQQPLRERFARWDLVALYSVMEQGADRGDEGAFEQAQRNARARFSSLQKASEASQGPSGAFKNMPNRGSTCFVSSSLQILHGLEKFRDMVLDLSDSTLICKPLEKSGRLATDWLTSAYDTAGSTPVRQSELSARHMANAKELAKKVQGILRQLGDNQPGDPSAKDVDQLWAALHAYDRKEYENRTENDAVTLFLELINCLILVTDDSLPSGRGQLGKVTSAQEEWRDHGEPKQSLADFCRERWSAFSDEGRVSAIFGLFASQVRTPFILPGFCTH